MYKILTKLYNLFKFYQYKAVDITYHGTKLLVSRGDLARVVLARGVVFLIFLPFTIFFLILGVFSAIISKIAMSIEVVVLIYIKRYLFNPIDDLKLYLGNKLEGMLL